MAQVSAGLLLYRRGPEDTEVFLVHPGGPFWANKDEAGWSIPKGLAEPGEDPEAVARREFTEEVGPVPPGPLAPLGEFRQPSGKTIAAFALEGDFDPAALRSNMVEIVWPPHSGKTLWVPEVDRGAWFGLADARLKLHVGQRPVLDAFAAWLGRGPR